MVFVLAYTFVAPEEGLFSEIKVDRYDNDSVCDLYIDKLIKKDKAQKTAPIGMIFFKLIFSRIPVRRVLMQ